MQRMHGLLVVAGLTMSHCSNETAFTERSSRQSKQQPTSGDAIPTVPEASPQPSSTPDPVPDRPVEPTPDPDPNADLEIEPDEILFDELNAAVIAKDTVSLLVARPDLIAKPTMRLQDIAELAPGSVWNESAGILRWQSDLQDIGRTVTSEFTVFADDQDASERILLEINADGEEGLLDRECDADNNRLEFKLIDMQRGVTVES